MRVNVAALLVGERAVCERGRTAKGAVKTSAPNKYALMTPVPPERGAPVSVPVTFITTVSPACGLGGVTANLVRLKVPPQEEM